jgi:hypothetical protein
MKTHNTLRMAFLNGKGDHLYTNGQNFVCISKNDTESAHTLKENGYSFMNFEQVMKQAHTETEPQAPKVLRTLKANPINEIKKATYKIKNTWLTSPDIYDFSDAGPGL